MKKIILALIILFLGTNRMVAQQEKFSVFGINIFTQLVDYDDYNTDMDTMAVHGSVGDPGNLRSNFGYGLSFISKVGYAEFGAHFF